MTDITISLQAQLIDAQSIEKHLRTRCMVLVQQLIDAEGMLKAVQDEMSARDTDLKAQIAGLQDDLRQARSQRIDTSNATDATKENADGE